MFAPTQGFIWGSSAASVQIEGAADRSDWSAWERDKATASGVGNGFAISHESDFAVLANLGVRHLRLTIPWAKIQTSEHTYSGAEIERYQQILLAARQAGLTITACLHHLETPGWFLDTGGFRDDGSTYRFSRWVDLCTEWFGDAVDAWLPIAEIDAYAIFGFYVGSYPPGRRSYGQFAEVLTNLIVATRDAWRLLRGNGQPVYADWAWPHIDNDAELERDATHPSPRPIGGIARQALISAFRDGVIDLPERPSKHVPDLARSADIIGISHTHPATAGPRFDVDRTGSADRAIGLLSRSLESLADAVPDHIVHLTNIGFGTTDDRVRMMALASTFDMIDSLGTSGLKIGGAWFRTPIDAYEFNNGWSLPFGLYDRSRTPRDSAEFVRRLIATGSTTVEDVA